MKIFKREASSAVENYVMSQFKTIEKGINFEFGSLFDVKYSFENFYKGFAGLWTPIWDSIDNLKNFLMEKGIKKSIFVNDPLYVDEKKDITVFIKRNSSKRFSMAIRFSVSFSNVFLQLDDDTKNDIIEFLKNSFYGAIIQTNSGLIFINTSESI